MQLERTMKEVILHPTNIELIDSTLHYNCANAQTVWRRHSPPSPFIGNPFSLLQNVRSSIIVTVSGGVYS